VVRDVSGAASWQNHAAMVDNSSTGTSADVLALRVGQTTAPGDGHSFLSFIYDGNTRAGYVAGNESGGVNYVSSGADYAEYLPKLDPTEPLLPGDVVGVFTGRVSKRTEGADQVMVVTTAPIIVGNMPDIEDAESSGQAKISFLGQAPVKVRGRVEAGDFLAPSGLGDGTAEAVAPEALRPDQLPLVFATAWEAKAGSGVGPVNAAIGIDQAAASVQVITALQDQVAAMQEHQAAMERQVATMRERQEETEKQVSTLLDRLERLEAWSSLIPLRRESGLEFVDAGDVRDNEEEVD
jgi:hypothetical protein